MSYSGTISADSPSSWLRFNNGGTAAVSDAVLPQWAIPGSTTLVNAGFTGIAQDGGSYLITPLSAWTEINDKYTTAPPPINLPVSGEVWVFPASFGSATGSTTILQWGYSGGFGFLAVGASGTYALGGGAVGGCNVNPTPIVWNLNQWLYLAFTWSSAGVFQVYRNGVADGSCSGATGNATYGIGAIIGAAQAGSPAFFVCEHATYTYVLTAAQVAAHYAAADQLARPRAVSAIQGICS